jgi:Sulfotransferase family
MKILRRLGAHFPPAPEAGASGRSSEPGGPRRPGLGTTIRGGSGGSAGRLLEGRPTVFFVVGHGKSGTTWLARLLGSHPEVLCLWEERFIGREWHREYLGEVEANVPPRTFSGAIAN